MSFSLLRLLSLMKLRLPPFLANGSLFELALLSFNITLTVFETFLASMTRYFRLIIYIFCPRPGINHSCRKPLFLLVGNYILRLHLGHQGWSLLLVGHCFQAFQCQGQEIYIYVFSHTIKQCLNSYRNFQQHIHINITLALLRILFQFQIYSVPKVSLVLFFFLPLLFRLKHLFISLFCFSSLIICWHMFVVSLYSLQTRLEFLRVYTTLFPALKRRPRKQGKHFAWIPQCLKFPLLVQQPPERYVTQVSKKQMVKREEKWEHIVYV